MAADRCDLLANQTGEVLDGNRKPLLPQWIGLHSVHQDTDSFCFRGALRVCRKRPHRPTADERNELAAFRFTPRDSTRIVETPYLPRSARGLETRWRIGLPGALLRRVKDRCWHSTAMAAVINYEQPGRVQNCGGI